MKGNYVVIHMDIVTPVHSHLLTLSQRDSTFNNETEKG